MNQVNYRRCVACKKNAPKSHFWRIVRLASSQVVQLDQGMGRSAYLCPNYYCLSTAKNKNRLQGALRTKVDPNIYQSLQERLS
ncbi:MAG: YlxR family protein [Cyanobacteria bacterium J06621_12]